MIKLVSNNQPIAEQIPTEISDELDKISQLRSRDKEVATKQIRYLLPFAKRLGLTAAHDFLTKLISLN